MDDMTATAHVIFHVAWEVSGLWLVSTTRDPLLAFSYGTTTNYDTN
jgi:hypothetical protein